MHGCTVSVCVCGCHSVCVSERVLKGVLVHVYILCACQCAHGQVNSCVVIWPQLVLRVHSSVWSWEGYSISGVSQCVRVLKGVLVRVHIWCACE